MRKTLPALVAVFLVAVVVFGNVVLAASQDKAQTPSIQVYTTSKAHTIKISSGNERVECMGNGWAFFCPAPKTPGVYEVYVDDKPTGKKVIAIRDSFDVDISSLKGHPGGKYKEALISQEDVTHTTTVTLPARNEDGTIYYPVILFEPGLDNIEKIDVEVMVWLSGERDKEGKVITCESTSLTVSCTEGVCEIPLSAVNEGPCKTDSIVDAKVIVRKIHIKGVTDPLQVNTPIIKKIEVVKPITGIELESGDYTFQILCIYGNKSMCTIKSTETQLCDDGTDNKCTGAKIMVPAGEYQVKEIWYADSSYYKSIDVSKAKISSGESSGSKISITIEPISIEYSKYLLVDKAYFLPEGVKIVAGSPEFEVTQPEGDEENERKAKLMVDMITIKSTSKYKFSGVVLEEEGVKCYLPANKESDTYTVDLRKTFIKPINNGKYSIFACKQWNEEKTECEELVDTGWDVSILEAPIEQKWDTDNKEKLNLRIENTNVGHVKVKYIVDNGDKLSEEVASYDNDEFEVPIDEKDVKEIYVYIGEGDGYKIHTISSKAITRSGDEKPIQLKYQGTKQEGGIVYNRYLFTHEDFAKYREIYLKLAIEKPDMDNPCINTKTGEKPRDLVIGYTEIKIALRMTELSGEIQVDKSTVKPGEQIKVTLTNLSIPDDGEYYTCYKYNSDTIQLDKLTNGEKYKNEKRTYTVDFYGVPGSGAEIKIPPDVSEIHLGICKGTQMSNEVDSVKIEIDNQCMGDVDQEYAIFWSPHIENWLNVKWEYVKDITNDIAKAIIFHALGQDVTYYHVGRYRKNGASYSCLKESKSISGVTAELKEDIDNPNQMVVKANDTKIEDIVEYEVKYDVSHNGKISYIGAPEDGALSFIKEEDHVLLPGEYKNIEAKIAPELTPLYWVPVSKTDAVTVKIKGGNACTIDYSYDGTISINECENAWAIVGSDDYRCGPGVVKGTWEDIDGSYTIPQGLKHIYILGKTKDGKYNIWYCKKNGGQWDCQSCTSQQ